MLFLDHTGLRERSDAVLAVCRELGGVWRVLGWARIIPRCWRDAVYRWVARNRYRLFGRRKTCWFPSPQDRGRIL